MPTGIPDWVADYIGIPFKEHGRDHDGADCWGLVRLVWRDHFDLAVPSFGEVYKTAYDGEEVGKVLDHGKAVDQGTSTPLWIEIAKGSERAGDGVLCKGYYKVDGKLRSAPMHVGVVVRSGYMLHVEEGIDASLADYRDLSMHRRVIGFYRHRELERRGDQ